MGHMLNRRLAAAVNAWWEAVLSRREQTLMVESVILKMKNKELLQVWG